VGLEQSRFRVWRCWRQYKGIVIEHRCPGILPRGSNVASNDSSPAQSIRTAPVNSDGATVAIIAIHWSRTTSLGSIRGSGIPPFDVVGQEQHRRREERNQCQRCCVFGRRRDSNRGLNQVARDAQRQRRQAASRQTSANAGQNGGNAGRSNSNGSVAIGASAGGSNVNAGNPESASRGTGCSKANNLVGVKSHWRTGSAALNHEVVVSITNNTVFPVSVTVRYHKNGQYDPQLRWRDRHQPRADRRGRISRNVRRGG